MIRGVLFDMDGVMIDSEPIILRSAIAFFKEKGVEVKAEDFTQFVGAGDRRYVCGVGELYGVEVDFDAESTRLYEFYQQFAREAGSFEGVHTFLEDARRSGLRVGLATGGEYHKTLINLEAIGLGVDDFDLVVTGEQVQRNKPNPDIYQLSALSMGLPTQQCLVIEDAINGVISAKRAESTVLAVTNSFNAVQLAEAGADLILSSLAAFGRFSTMEEFHNRLAECSGADGRTRYGANRILTADPPPPGSSQRLSLAIEEAYRRRSNAYAPYSNFKVGSAVVSSKSGRVYGGCNVENSSYGATICAERSAVLNAIAHEGVTGIDLLVVVSDDTPPAVPCAQCLQVLAEFSNADMEVHLIDIANAEGREGTHRILRFDELLPHPFIFPTKRLE
jgi:homotetrameric cytidine deaminase